MAWPKCGHNALVYVSGTEVVGTAWSLDITSETVELRKFGDTWVTRCKTFSDWAGSIDALDDVKVLTDAATATTSVAVLLYHDRSTATEYFSGNAFFGASAGASVDGPATAGASFVGDDTLTVAGYA